MSFSAEKFNLENSVCPLFFPTISLSRVAFHSTKNSKNFERRTNGTKISTEIFQEIRKLLTFRKVNHSIANSGNSERKIKWNGNSRKEIFTNLGIPREVVRFSRNSGKCCTIHSWKFSEIQPRIFHRVDVCVRLYLNCHDGLSQRQKNP